MITNAETAAHTSPAANDDLRAIIGRLAHRLGSGQTGPGSLAALRRGAATDVMREAAFHRLMSDVDERLLRDDGALRWATVVQAMAIGATATGGGRAEPAGKALASAGLSDARFSRLLASRGATLRDQALLVARHMHAKGVPLAWDQLGILILVDDRYDDWADRLRMDLARDFYRSLGARNRD